MTDPIADMLTRIRNALVVKHEEVDIPASNMKKEIARILLAEGYINGYELTGDNKELLIIPGASHVDLYDRTDVIPFEKLRSFFEEHLNSLRWRA